LDQLPLCADWIAVRELSAEKSGMFSSSTAGGGVTGGGVTGGGVPDTVTLVDALLLPPSPVQVRE
jgi:hypothetical protein